MRYLIGIDLGTSATKTVLFDETGKIIASASREYPLYQPQNGWAEQKPEDWKKATLETLKEVVETSHISKENIKGLGISGQMHGLVMLDERGEVLRPAIIWCDQRTGKECEEIIQRVGKERLIELTANPALTGFTASKILWVRKYEPDTYAKCRHILLPKDYIRYVLTGIFATEVSDASGMQLLDVPNRCWSDEVLEKLEIEKELLPKVYESIEVTGTISSEIAQRTGLSAETIVVGGAGDNAAAAVGTGIVKEGRAFTTIGTSGVVYAHSNKVVIDKKGRVHTFCCAVPGAWQVMGVTQSAGLSLKWFKDNFCENYIIQAERENKDVYELINQVVEKIPIGSGKLIYLPYLMGERTPHLDPDCRGAFFGLSAIHTRENMLRAVMEGVSYSLKDCYEILVEMGIGIEEMMVCGGGGKSPVWKQMLADLYGCQVKTVTAKEGPALGAAILAGVGAGIYKDVEEGCQRVLEMKDGCAPNEKEREQYLKYYEIYKELYPNLKQEFQKLQEIGK